MPRTQMTEGPMVVRLEWDAGMALRRPLWAPSVGKRVWIIQPGLRSSRGRGRLPLLVYKPCAGRDCTHPLGDGRGH